MENAYRQKANNLATILPLVSADLVEGKADMDIKAGIYQAENLFGLKLVAWFGENETLGLPALTGMTMVFDLKTGFPRALINSRHLTAMRTGAAGAVGIKYLAKQNAEVLVVVGTGYQAVFHIAATLTAVPTIRKVCLYDPRNEEKARLLHESIRTKLGRIRNDICDLKSEKWIQRIETVEFSAVNNIESALSETDAVITITPSRQASKVGEIQTAIRLGMLQKETITEIGNVINENEKGRLSNKDITVFDSTGIALQDIAVSDYLLKIAEEKNIGTIVNL